MNHHGTRLPIFQDDLSFRDRNFGDISRQMQEDLARHGFGSGATRMFPKWSMNDDMDSIMQNNFFDLRPRNPKLSTLKRDDGGSRESLDDDTLNGLYKTNPNNSSRKFEISFDVKDYDPNNISVRVEGDALIVEARSVSVREGGKSQKEFNRKIAIPKDVDVEKLTSTLSNDGILSVIAPVPPKYHEVTYPRAQVSPNPIPLPQGQRVVTEAYISPSQNQHSPRNSQNYPSPRSSSGYSGGRQSPGYSQPQTQHRDYQPQSSREYQQSPGSYQQSPGSGYQQSPGSGYQSPQGGYQSPQGGYHSPQGSYYSQQPSQPSTPSSNYAPSQPAQSPVYNQPVLPLDTPVYSSTDNVGGRRMDLMLEVGKAYLPDDLVVKIEGLKLIVDAEHEEKHDGKSSKTSMHREFDMSEDIDSHTVQAMLRTDGKLIITACVKK